MGSKNAEFCVNDRAGFASPSSLREIDEFSASIRHQLTVAQRLHHVHRDPHFVKFFIKFT